MPGTVSSSRMMKRTGELSNKRATDRQTAGQLILDAQSIKPFGFNIILSPVLGIFVSLLSQSARASDFLLIGSIASARGERNRQLGLLRDVCQSRASLATRTPGFLMRPGGHICTQPVSMSSGAQRHAERLDHSFRCTVESLWKHVPIHFSLGSNLMNSNAAVAFFNIFRRNPVHLSRCC